MISKVTLEYLIDWLEKQDPEMIVKDGFGSGHSDRGSYDNLAFKPLPEAKISDMLEHAKSCVDVKMEGYKGGIFKMHPFTPCYIGQWGECGEAITKAHFKYWLLHSSKKRNKQRIKIFNGSSLEDLENKTNQWLQDNPNYVVNHLTSVFNVELDLYHSVTYTIEEQ